MEDPSFAGLAAAWQAFDRSRNREGYEAVSVRLRLSLTPFDTAEFPELVGTEFGMQDSKGDLIPGERLPGGRIRFDVGVVARRQRETGVVTFIGPYAHGPAGDEFLYLNWRKPGGGKDWVWRRKFRLTALSWDALVAADAARDLFAFDGTGRMGHSTVPVEWQRGPHKVSVMALDRRQR
ncbi:MAG: DUF5990 family protein [Tepidiformaceae bacterium]